MGDGKEITKEAISAINKTKQLVEAGLKLKEFRDRIDEIIHTINSGGEIHDDLADECVDIGVRIQGVSKNLRPISVEGMRKNIDKKINARWKQKYRKALSTSDKAWIEKYTKPEDSKYMRFRASPSSLFIKDYCSDLE